MALPTLRRWRCRLDLPTTDDRANADKALRELAVRAADGLRVALFWRPAHGDVLIRVDDAETGASFERRVRGERALHAFHHPYLYAPSTARVA
jgi:hypothetical protein